MAIELIDLRILFRAFRLEIQNQNAFSVARMMKQYRLFYARSYQRRQLRHLDDCQLKDMGISRVDALREADKPFWAE